jgi:hypothetical protein
MIGSSENTGWEQLFDHARNSLVNYLKSPSAGSSILRDSQAVGLGFVDGDLKIVCKQEL